VFPETRDDLLECTALRRRCKRGELDAIVPHDAPLDVLTQQIVAETSAADDAVGEAELFAMARRAGRTGAGRARTSTPWSPWSPTGSPRARGRRAGAAASRRVHGTVRARRGARLLAQVSAAQFRGGRLPGILDPGDTFIGTLNEDFAIESNAGDVFQLGTPRGRSCRSRPAWCRVAEPRARHRRFRSGSARRPRAASSCRER
jgi:ATP-dependent Lhr-like helicase